MVVAPSGLQRPPSRQQHSKRDDERVDASPWTINPSASRSPPDEYAKRTLRNAKARHRTSRSGIISQEITMHEKLNCAFDRSRCCQ